MKDPTTLSFWFPKVLAAGLSVPRTEIVADNISRKTLFGAIGEDEYGPAEKEQFRALVKAVEEAGDRVGWPCFLRTGVFSGKHSWEETCFVPSRDVVAQHILRIFEDGECVDFFGLDSSEWVVREFLKTEPMFHAFWGKMPITRERRYFVRDGVVEWKQPYWPPHSILRPDREDWRSVLEADNARLADDDVLLHPLSLKVSAAVPGFWSVDWLWTTNHGWVLTDMAEGDKSFRWDPAHPKEDAEEDAEEDASLKYKESEE